MLVDKETWASLSKKEKKQKISDCLIELHKIDLKDHPLYGTPKQGKLVTIRKSLEEFILNTLEWETL